MIVRSVVRVEDDKIDDPNDNREKCRMSKRRMAEFKILLER